ncbi:BamA/TamA family outer membrane protein, partial [Brucella sp. 21LCYQ03]|nr:BamA/TamA family outer membrane protein [Brucella sp. 21LCYQ03]
METNDRQYFGLGSQYAITYNGNKLNRVENFSFLRGMVDVSGNTLGLLSNLFNFNTDEQGQRLVFNVPYLQYIKGEVDYRLYRHLGGNRQFVFRLNGGVAVPYGNNSTLLIFEKSFFAGGMNGIRAWQARTLGPGNYSREGLTEDLRVNLRNLDQLGEVKLETNAEFRFRILNKFLGARLNGATFLDAGNVWRLRELTPNL